MIAHIPPSTSVLSRDHLPRI